MTSRPLRKREVAATAAVFVIGGLFELVRRGTLADVREQFVDLDARLANLETQPPDPESNPAPALLDMSDYTIGLRLVSELLDEDTQSDGWLAATTLHQLLDGHVAVQNIEPISIRNLGLIIRKITR